MQDPEGMDQFVSTSLGRREQGGTRMGLGEEIRPGVANHSQDLSQRKEQEIPERNQ